MVCREVGAANPDISGLGMIISFTIVGGICCALSVFAYVLHLKEQNPERISCLATFQLKRQILRKVLLSVADAQIINVIALALTAVVQGKNLTFYHRRINHDSTALTMASLAASMAVLPTKVKRSHGRAAPILVLFLVLAFWVSNYCLFYLFSWSSEEAGHCFEGQYVIGTSDNHPATEIVYALHTFASFIFYLYLYFTSPFHKWRTPISLAIPILDYILHLYMLVMLRASNVNLLKGESENSWGYGQVIAITLCSSTALECLRGFFKYRIRVFHYQSEQPEGSDSSTLSEPISPMEEVRRFEFPTGDAVITIDEGVAIAREALAVSTTMISPQMIFEYEVQEETHSSV